MKPFERELLMLVYNSTVLTEHMTHCVDTEYCSTREFLSANLLKSFMYWLTLHGVSEQTMHRAETNEVHARIIEDLMETLKELTDGDKDLDVIVSEIRTKTLAAVEQIKIHTTTLRN